MKKILVIIILLLSTHVHSDWVQVPGFSDNQFLRLTNDGTNIYAGTNNVYISTNTGVDWSIFYNSIYFIYALNIVNNNVWIGFLNENYYTSNSGVNWININLNQYTYWFASHNSKIFAGTESHGCFISSNNGANWYQSGYIWDDVSCFLSSGNKLFAGTSQGLYCTTNDGVNWVLTSAPVVGVLSLVNNGPKLFAGTLVGVYSSTNNGDNWEQTSLGNFTVSLEYYEQNIFAGTNNNGFYVSTNNGNNWIQKNEGMGNQTINALTVINNYIFAGTETAGLWKRPLSEIVGISTIGTEIPSSFSLHQNYPNPFNPVTKIRFEIPLSKGGQRGLYSTLKIFDILGREVVTLVNESLKPGTYEVTFDGSNLSNGVYFYKLQTGNILSIKKMLLIK
jgi:hypothetical protein